LRYSGGGAWMDYNMKELLEENFNDDPIFREIQINKIDLDEVFTDSIIEMHPETTYSTVEAGKIIGRKDSTLRNYFRTELEDYVAPERSGKYYRLNYQSVFRLHMILLLVEKANKTTVDIGYALGISALSSNGSSIKHKRRATENSLEPSQENNNSQLNELKKMMLIQNMRQVELQERANLTNLKVELTNIDREMDSIYNKIEIVKLTQEKELTNNKYYKVLDYTLRNTRAGNKETKKGFWAFFKPQSDEDEVDIDQVLREASTNAEKELAATAEVEEETKELKTKLKELEEDKKKKEKEIDNQVLKITNVEAKVKYLNDPSNEVSIDQLSKFLIDSNTND
jgi:hypothetical protein